MKTILTCISLLTLAFSLQAREISHTFTSKDYKTALKSNHCVRFDMNSTKAGMITTPFTGVVKDFSVSFQLNGDNLRRGKISFKVADMDTDSKARDRKMHNYCLDMASHPEITVDFGYMVLMLGKSINVGGMMTIRGEKKGIDAEVKAERVGEAIRFTGHAWVKLSKLGIPDPSIAVASVNDNVKITFDVTVPL